MSQTCLRGLSLGLIRVDLITGVVRSMCLHPQYALQERFRAAGGRTIDRFLRGLGRREVLVVLLIFVVLLSVDVLERLGCLSGLC